MYGKKMLSFVSNFFSLKQLNRWANQKCIFPFYHIVSDQEVPYIKHLYPIIGTQEFSEDIDFLLKNFQPLTASKLIQQLKESKTNNKTKFFLSFDDGLREFYEVAAPILHKKGVPATCFINSDFVDNKALFYRMKASLLTERTKSNPLSKAEFSEIQKIFNTSALHFSEAHDFLKITSANQAILDQSASVLEIDFNEFLRDKKPYMTSEQIRELTNQGFSIGAHSASHPNYELIDEAEQVTETLKSIRYIKENFTIYENLFSFPFTDHLVKKSFFEQISSEIDLTFGTANIKMDQITTNLQRIPMERLNRKNARKIVKTELLAFIIKKGLNKHIIIRD